MGTFTIEYPETLLAIIDLQPKFFEQEARMAMGVKLFEMGRLTSGQAATLVGISRINFLLNCHRFGVSSVEWDENELETEFSQKIEE